VGVLVLLRKRGKPPVCLISAPISQEISSDYGRTQWGRRLQVAGAEGGTVLPRISVGLEEGGGRGSPETSYRQSGGSRIPVSSGAEERGGARFSVELKTPVERMHRPTAHHDKCGQGVP